MLPWLPVMTGRVVDSLEASERFLWDLRKTISELNNDNYAGRAAELAHQHGMKLSIEAYGSGMFDDISYGGRADSPMGEFWIGGSAIETLKDMSSAGHVYGRNIVGAESFTAVTEVAKWMNSPQTIKSLGDTAFCEGINRFVFHRYAMQPWLNRVPGMTMGPWGIHYERTETWWNQTGPWHEYLARCNYLLRQGLFVADICYLQTGRRPRTALAYAPRTAYAFDGCPPEVVLTRMKVEDGRLVLPDGMSYRLLALPPSETMTPVLLAKIKELVEAGATVVGSKPLKSPSLSDYPKCDADLQQLVAELWGDCDGKTVTEHACGKGKVICGKTPEAVLAEMGVPPDFLAEKITSQTPTSRYIHRAADGTDIYFVSNAGPRAVDTGCTFRVKGKRPELWHPDTGRVEPVAVTKKLTAALGFRCGSMQAARCSWCFGPRPAPAADAVVAISRDGKPVMGSSRPSPKIVVQNAVYGVSGDAARTRNVTGRVQKMTRQGEFSFQVARMAEDGDPAYGIVKTLTVEYTVNGKPCRTSATDPETIELLGEQEPRDAEVRYDDGRLCARSREARPLRVEIRRGQDGRRRRGRRARSDRCRRSLGASVPRGMGRTEVGHARQVDLLVEASQRRREVLLRNGHVPEDDPSAGRHDREKSPRVSRLGQRAGARPGEAQRQRPGHPLEAPLPHRRDRRRAGRRQHAGSSRDEQLGEPPDRRRATARGLEA